MNLPDLPDEESRTLVQQQTVLAEIGQQALERDDLDRLLRDAAVAVVDTLSHDYCMILDLLPAGDEFFLR